MGKRAYRTVLIGAGNVATHLQQALISVGHEVTAVGGRTRRMPIHQDADLYVIAVSDAAIGQVSGELADVSGLVVHTSGSVPLATLTNQRRGVLYPLQTFSASRAVDFRRVPLFIESDTDADFLLEIAVGLASRVTFLESEKRKYLHLAAVFCCNFVNRMYGIAADLLQEQQMGFDWLLPLIEETSAKVSDMSPREAQTGPAVRWDEEVMDRHLSQLSDPDLKSIYQLISKNIHDDKLRSQEDQGADL